MEKIDNHLDAVLRCNLKNLMNEYDDGAGISANKLSKELNERRSTINDLVANNDMDIRHIPARLIAKLCSFLDVTPCELFSIEYVSKIADILDD